MLAIMTDDKLACPPLEFVFTTQEEIGLLGAMKLKAEDFKARQIISLDGGGETTTMLSSAGGVRVEVNTPISFVENNLPSYKLRVKGLLGGHSGMEIDKEKGNSNKLMARLLMEAISNDYDITLISFKGGLKDNAIPRECDVCFVSSSDFSDLKQQLEQSAQQISEELQFSDNGFNIQFSAIDVANKHIDKKDSDNIINFLYLAPNGFKAKSMAIADLTITSLNLGVTKTNTDCFSSCFAIRSVLDSALDDLILQLKVLSGYFNSSIITSARYPGWNYNPESKLRDKLAEAVKELYQDKELQLVAGHGGCECGVFSQLIADADIIQIGPITKFAHTPDEAMDLASFDRAYTLLCHVIAKCK